MSKKIFKSASVLAASLATGFVVMMSTPVFAEDGKALYISKGCVACHGADAKTPIMPLYPKIAGQSKEYVEQQLKDIKSGARSNGQSAAMKGVMASVSDDDMKAIAEYISSIN